MTMQSLTFKRRKNPIKQKSGSVRRDWMRVLLLFFILNVLAIGFAGYVFMSVDDDVFVSASAGTQENIINEAVLKETIDRYAAKGLLYEQYLVEPPVAPEI